MYDYRKVKRLAGLNLRTSAVVKMPKYTTDIHCLAELNPSSVADVAPSKVFNLGIGSDLAPIQRAQRLAMLQIFRSIHCLKDRRAKDQPSPNPYTTALKCFTKQRRTIDDYLEDILERDVLWRPSKTLVQVSPQLP